MSIKNTSEDKFLISFADLCNLFRRAKWKILFFTILFGLLGAIYALSKPIKYKAEGTFREKTSRGGANGFLAQSLLVDTLGMSSNDSEFVDLLKSRKLMERVTKRLNLQGYITPVCMREGVLSRIQKNMKIEWNLYKRSYFPILEDFNCPLKIENILYEGEIPIFFSVRILDNSGKFELKNLETKQILIGNLNESFSTGDFSFILKYDSSNAASLEEFDLILSPSVNIATQLTKDLEIEISKSDKEIAKLSYADRDRHLASLLINTSMQVYQEHIRDYNEKFADRQLAYLNRRKDETVQILKNLMYQHAEFLSNDLLGVGFADSKKEMDFLAKNQHELKEKLLSNELEIKRLKGIQPNNYAYYDRYSPKDEGVGIINELLMEMRKLRYHRDSLELALRRNDQNDNLLLKNAFNQQLNELKQVQHYKSDLIKIIQSYQARELPSSSLLLLQDQRFIIQEWFDRFINKTDNESFQTTKDSLGLYLDNLGHLLNVHEKVLQERLAHQQNPSEEYEGINLETANNLYLQNCQNLSKEESSLKQMQFVLNQMNDPSFEIISLSTLLTDTVSLEMIKKASDLILNLKDEKNQSVREQERLKEQIYLQKTFLTFHLTQIIQLIELNKDLIHKKIFGLQSINLELTNQKITLLDKSFREYIRSRLENLEQERALIQQHLSRIYNEMAALPKKWMAEQLIEQQVTINQSIVNEVAKIVESKNISYNLEFIQSAPMDLSLPPLQPNSVGLILYTILGSILGGFLGVGLTTWKLFVEGIPITEALLKSLNLQVAGSLSALYDPGSKKPIADQDLNTLRRLQSYLDISNIGNFADQSTQPILLIEGKGPNYAFDLGSLFAKKGYNLLILDLDFNHSSSVPGLLQYLQGEINELPVIRCECGDYLPAGDISRFSTELLASRAFKNLMEKLKSRYECIIAVSRALPCSPEAESLTSLFSFIIVTINDEKIEELAFYTDLAQHPNKKLGFIIQD